MSGRKAGMTGSVPDIASSHPLHATARIVPIRHGESEFRND
jgi:hypothetical protein